MVRRVGSAVGAAALGAMVLAGPASAAFDPGEGPVEHVSSMPTTSESGVEYVQLGLGALGGMALGGAAVAVVDRMRHRRQVRAA